jgi:uncharacterized protein (TIGR03083 family)
MLIQAHREALQEQARALRAAAVRAGGGAPVPTCPEWDVRALVRHLAKVYGMVLGALGTERGGRRPEPASAPQEFDAALEFWDEKLAELLSALAAADPDQPVWAFFTGGSATAWTRRMAHETAIHRLDAEHAAGCAGSGLVFDPQLAADGADEMLSVLVPVFDWSGQQRAGKVLYHAADAERAWLVTFRAGACPELGRPEDAALGQEVDATVAGTADAVYRKVWGRPSPAVITGDADLATVISGR